MHVGVVRLRLLPHPGHVGGEQRAADADVPAGGGGGRQGCHRGGGGTRCKKMKIAGPHPIFHFHYTPFVLQSGPKNAQMLKMRKECAKVHFPLFCTFHPSFRHQLFFLLISFTNPAIASTCRECAHVVYPTELLGHLSSSSSSKKKSLPTGLLATFPEQDVTCLVLVLVFFSSFF